MQEPAGTTTVEVFTVKVNPCRRYQRARDLAQLERPGSAGMSS